MKPIRLLLADDNPIFRSLTTSYLIEVGGFEVVAATANGEQAIEQTRKLSPDVVLLDLEMPGINGLQATRHIAATENPPVIIILTLYDDAEHRRAAREAGASGFVSKQMLRTELVSCILCHVKIEALPPPRGDHAPVGKGHEIDRAAQPGGALLSTPGSPGEFPYCIVPAPPLSAPFKSLAPPV